jgi:hypothetical protein
MAGQWPFGPDPVFLRWLEDHAVATDHGRACTISAGETIPEVGTWRNETTYWESPAGWVPVDRRSR